MTRCQVYGRMVLGLVYYFGEIEMNDMFLIGCAAAVAVCFILAYLATFSNAASLCEAKIGQVYDFEYLQPLNGERKRWKARVVEPVSHFSNAKLEQMNRSSNYRRDDKDFKRTNHLVTCETQDGEYRQFYCERAVNCRKPLFGIL